MRNRLRVSGCSDIATAVGSALGSALPATLETAKRLKRYESDAIFAASTFTDVRASQQLLDFRQLCALYTKNPSLSGSTDSVRRAAAIMSFSSSERKLRRVNKRLRYYLNRPSRGPELVMKCLFEAKHDIFRLLGCPTELVLVSDTWDNVRFGPGLVQGMEAIPAVDTTPYGKLSPEVTITGTADLLQYWGRSIPTPFRRQLDKRQAEVREYCRVTCVPKDAVTDRAIAIEPYLNGFIQLGQMNVLNRYLRRWGLDNRDQTRNQRLALEASKPGAETATLDLSQASDSVSTELVRFLLPPVWFRWCSSTRCRFAKVDDELIELEKFSSMGNGITFPLETLIFAALVRACRRLSGDRTAWSVYGDDIIVGQRSSLLLIEVLKFCGFATNTAKSFVFGHFKESCGKDYLGGHPVRPYFLKGDLRERRHAYKLFNQLQQSPAACARRFCSYLLESIASPHVGVATSTDGICDTHLVAPAWYFYEHKRSQVRKHRDRLMDFQTIEFKFERLEVRHRSVGEKAKSSAAGSNQALWAWLIQQQDSGRHFVRGEMGLSSRLHTVRYIVPGLQYDVGWFDGESR